VANFGVSILAVFDNSGDIAIVSMVARESKSQAGLLMRVSL